MIQKIDFKPGIIRETTEYANSGGWFDADKVRFRAGYPEKIGGWQAVTKNPFVGTCRALHQWSSVEFDRYIALGTDDKLYILWGNFYYDITPIRKVQALATTDPIWTDTMPDILRVDCPSHGMVSPGDYFVLSGVTSNVDRFTPAMLNTEFQVHAILDVDHFTFQYPNAPAGAMTDVNLRGGGSTVTVTFYIPGGLNNAVIGTGWGVPPWGGGTNFMTPVPPAAGSPWTGWGAPFDPRLLNPVGYDINQIRLWDIDNFGEDLVANIRHGGIYYWHQGGGLNLQAAPLSQAVNIGGVEFTPNDVPVTAVQILVSPNDRHLIAMGCEDVQQTVPDPMLVRWSSEEDAYDWEPRRDNSAGGQRLSAGSYIISGLRTRQEILIWTDLGLWSMKYIGTPYIFGFDVVAEGLSIIGPNAAINAGNMLFWMDRGIFYAYTGQVQELPCTVKDYVFSDMNYTQQYKICAGHNHAFSEVIWFYVSASSGPDNQEIDRYVLYNYVDQTWSIGGLQRTAWLDMGRSTYPIAANATDHLLFYHELGTDADGAPLPAYIESSDLDQGGGDHFLFLGRLIPDVQFRGTGQTQTVGISVLKRNAALGTKDVAAQITVTPNSGQMFTRVRGRQLSVRVESSALGVGWRLGTLRGDLQVDGKR